MVRGLVNDGIVGQDTTVLVTVPAYQSLFSSHDVQLKHYRRYSLRSLRHALSSAGLRVVESGTFFVSLLPLRALVALRLVRARRLIHVGLAGYGRWSEGRRCRVI